MPQNYKKNLPKDPNSAKDFIDCIELDVQKMYNDLDPSKGSLSGSNREKILKKIEELEAELEAALEAETLRVIKTAKRCGRKYNGYDVDEDEEGESVTHSTQSFSFVSRVSSQTIDGDMSYSDTDTVEDEEYYTECDEDEQEFRKLRKVIGDHLNQYFHRASDSGSDDNSGGTHGVPSRPSTFALAAESQQGQPPTKERFGFSFDVHDEKQPPVSSASAGVSGTDDVLTREDVDNESSVKKTQPPEQKPLSPIAGTLQNHNYGRFVPRQPQANAARPLGGYVQQPHQMRQEHKTQTQQFVDSNAADEEDEERKRRLAKGSDTQIDNQNPTYKQPSKSGGKDYDYNFIFRLLFLSLLLLAIGLVTGLPFFLIVGSLALTVTAVKGLNVTNDDHKRPDTNTKKIETNNTVKEKNRDNIEQVAQKSATPDPQVHTDGLKRYEHTRPQARSAA
jgi:hypothetical protein